MRAVVLEEVGGPEKLVVRDVPEPTPGEGQSLVEVRATGINYLDVLVRRGQYPQPPPLPWVPGSEFAGNVGGRRILGLAIDGGGCYAERAAVPDAWLFDLPAAADYVEGASFLMAFLTAWIPMTRQAPVRPGARVLVTAAAGGVGTAAIQVARALGAEVVAAAGAPEKLDLARSLGAAEAVTYGKLGDVDPVDVVVDQVGGEVLAASLRSLRPLGVAVAVGFAGGAWHPLDPTLLVGRNVSLAGFYLGRLMRHRPELVHDAARDVLRLWERGIVRPVVGASFPLEQAAKAHALIEERRSTGKVVLVP